MYPVNEKPNEAFVVEGAFLSEATRVASHKFLLG
jgi:hypothetical protein